MAAAKSPDLKIRVLSAGLMVAVAGAAFWAGGAVFAIFCGLIGLCALFEWQRLVMRIAQSAWARALWLAGGIAYLGSATVLLALMRFQGLERLALMLIGLVIVTDVGAFFVGRAVGGPKIAPSVSPSKTWAGLAGGMTAAGGLLALLFALSSPEARAMPIGAWPLIVGAGAMFAIVAQTGDFFESWMKRRAGVKDSGQLIPGHGGILDRIDGMIPVVIIGWCVIQGIGTMTVGT